MTSRQCMKCLSVFLSTELERFSGICKRCCIDTTNPLQPENLYEVMEMHWKSFDAAKRELVKATAEIKLLKDDITQYVETTIKERRFQEAEERLALYLARKTWGKY